MQNTNTMLENAQLVTTVPYITANGLCVKFNSL